jgi:hypothetical protein
MTGQYEASPLLVGILVACAIAGSLGVLVWVELSGRRR